MSLSTFSFFLFFFFSGAVFHRPLIFLLFSLQNAHLVNFYLYNPSSNHFLLSIDKQNCHTFLIFWNFNLPMWAGMGKTAYTLCHRHVCLVWDLSANWLVWFFLFLDSTFPLPHITWTYWPISIQPSNWSLVARCCLPFYTPILGKLDHQSVSTWPWLKFNSSDFLSTSTGLSEKKKRERESLYLWVKYELDYSQGPKS